MLLADCFHYRQDHYCASTNKIRFLFLRNIKNRFWKKNRPAKPKIFGLADFFIFSQSVIFSSYSWQAINFIITGIIRRVSYKNLAVPKFFKLLDFFGREEPAPLVTGCFEDELLDEKNLHLYFQSFLNSNPKLLVSCYCQAGFQPHDFPQCQCSFYSFFHTIFIHLFHQHDRFLVTFDNIRMLSIYSYISRKLHSHPQCPDLLICFYFGCMYN